MLWSRWHLRSEKQVAVESQRRALAPAIVLHNVRTHRTATPRSLHHRAIRQQLIPPNWIPVIMLVLLIGGGLLIMARYLIFTESNWPTLAGLIAILGGLYTATKWQ